MGGGETKRTESRAWAAVRPNMEDLWKTRMHAPVSGGWLSVLKRKTWPDFATKNATSIPPFPFFSPSLISLAVSLHVKHRVYFTYCALRDLFSFPGLSTNREPTFHLFLTPRLET